MIALETENPDLAGTRTGADMEIDTREVTTTSSARQDPRPSLPSLLVALAAWLLRLAHRRREREIQNGWDAALSLQLDRLTDIRERLAEYLNAERGKR